MEKICRESGRQLKSIEPEAMKALQGLPWTGNIRELHNVIERLIILCGNTITKEDVEIYAIPR